MLHSMVRHGDLTIDVHLVLVPELSNPLLEAAGPIENDVTDALANDRTCRSSIYTS